MKYSIVVPVHNSRESLGELTARISAVFEGYGSDHEIILVEDGSEDSSWDRLKELRETTPEMKLIRLSGNFGQQIATICGMRFARGDYIITMDDDLQHPPEEIPRLIAAMREGVDVVFGAFDEGDNGFLRRLGSGIRHAVTRALFRTPKGFKASGFRIISRKIADAVAKTGNPHPSINALILSMTKNIRNVKVQHKARKYGSSNYTVRTLLALLVNLIFSCSGFPVRFAAGLGLFISLLGFLYGGTALAKALYIKGEAEGWAVLTLLVSVLSGSVMLLLGIIGEYLSRMLDVMYGRALYIVEEVCDGKAGPHEYSGIPERRGYES